MAQFNVSATVTLDMAADPHDIYRLVSDVTRIGEWSPECHSAEWIGDSTGPEVGARFRGRNQWKLNRWSRTCEVLVADPSQKFSFRTVPGFGASADSTVWSYKIESIDGGARVTESYEIVKLPQRWFRPVIRRFMPHHLDMSDHMLQTLDAIRNAAEGAEGR